MKYLDLEKTAPKEVPPTPPPPKPRKRWLKPLIILTILGSLIYAGYVLFWPASATIGDLFKAPVAILSFIRPPEESLKSTDGRTNILLVGIDRRANEPYTYKDKKGNIIRNCFRSDTLIVASVDLKAKNKDVVFISVPRDLWVQIPGWTEDNGTKVYPQSNRINAPYCFGDRDNYPNGYGIGLSRDMMQQILGIPIHYAVRVDFYGFKQAVDAVGGISVNVETSFTDCEYPTEGYGYQCVSFKKGLTYMNGEKALAYARSRHGNNGEGSDLMRAKRQQKVLLAIRDKALTLPTLTDPLKVSALIKSLSDTFQTLDIDFSQIGQFYKVAQALNISSSKNIVLTNNPTDPAGLLISPPLETYGASVFIPRLGEGNYKEIQAYVKKVLAEATLQQEATSSAQGRGQ